MEAQSQGCDWTLSYCTEVDHIRASPTKSEGPFFWSTERTVLLEPHTSVVDVPEGRIDELPEVPGLLCDVHQQRDGEVLAAIEVEQGFRQTGFTCGWLWHRKNSVKNETAAENSHLLI